MAVLKSTGSALDEVLRAHAVVIGVVPSSLSVRELEAALRGVAAPGVLVEVVRGRVQVTYGSESICLLLPADPALPAFPEERPCG